MTTLHASSDEDFSIAIPIKLRFTALEDYVNTNFTGKIISNVNADGKEKKYFKVLHVAVAQSTMEGYNIEFIVTLETLTTFYRNHELKVSIQTFLTMDLKSQTMYVERYKIDSLGSSWITNKLLESVINTFIYKKIIDNLKVEIAPIIQKQLMDMNTKLASKFEVNDGISLLGELKNLNISNFEIKEDNFWIIINISGWGVIDIDKIAL